MVKGSEPIVFGDYEIIKVKEIPGLRSGQGAPKVIEFLYAHPGEVFRVFSSENRNQAYSRYTTLKRIATKRYGDSVVLKIRTIDGVTSVYGSYQPDVTISGWEEAV